MYSCLAWWLEYLCSKAEVEGLNLGAHVLKGLGGTPPSAARVVGSLLGFYPRGKLPLVDFNFSTLIDDVVVPCGRSLLAHYNVC